MAANHIIPLSVGCDGLPADCQQRRGCCFRGGVRKGSGAAVDDKGGGGASERVCGPGDGEGGAAGGEDLAGYNVVACAVGCDGLAIDC